MARLGYCLLAKWAPGQVSGERLRIYPRGTHASNTCPDCGALMRLRVGYRQCCDRDCKKIIQNPPEWAHCRMPRLPRGEEDVARRIPRKHELKRRQKVDALLAKIEGKTE